MRLTVTMKSRFKTGIALFLFVAAAFLLSNCGKENGQNNNNVPSVPVNITVNTNLPEYLNLQSQGTWVYLSGGVRGIVLYHHYDDKFYALDRNCPYNSQDSCATVTVENDVFLRCGHHKSETDTTWVPCCNSLYSLEAGYLVSGPSQFPLRNYRVSQSGNFITITN